MAYKFEIHNNSGLAVADIGFTREGALGLVLFEDVGIRYEDDEELQIDLALLQNAGYNVSAECIWRND